MRFRRARSCGFGMRSRLCHRPRVRSRARLLIHTRRLGCVRRLGCTRGLGGTRGFDRRIRVRCRSRVVRLRLCVRCGRTRSFSRRFAGSRSWLVRSLSRLWRGGMRGRSARGFPRFRCGCPCGWRTRRLPRFRRSRTRRRRISWTRSGGVVDALRRSRHIVLRTRWVRSGRTRLRAVRTSGVGPRLGRSYVHWRISCSHHSRSME